jgi:hypothetical protein
MNFPMWWRGGVIDLEDQTVGLAPQQGFTALRLLSAMCGTPVYDSSIRPRFISTVSSDNYFHRWPPTLS